MRLRLPATVVTLAVLATAGTARAADPTTADCLAATETSIKMGNEHKLRAERSQLLVCAAASCPADIRKDCVGRVDEVNRQIPTIIFRAKDGSGADLTAVRVKMDAEVIAERLEGTAVSIDPGEHTFTFETVGQPAITKKLLIQQDQKDRVEQVAFGGAAPPRPATAAPAAATSATPGGESPSAGGGIGTQKVVALVAGGLGVVGLGVGTVLGVVALSQKSTAQSACPGSLCATKAEANQWSTAVSTGNVSTVALAAGGVLLGAGAVLWFTAPGSSDAGGTQVGLGPGSVQLKGTW